MLELLPLLTSVIIIVRVANKEQFENTQLLKPDRVSSQAGIEVYESKFQEDSSISSGFKRATTTFSPF